MKTRCSKIKTKQNRARSFPGSPMVQTSHFPCRGHGFDPGSGNKKILHAVWHGQKLKKKKK